MNVLTPSKALVAALGLGTVLLVGCNRADDTAVPAPEPAPMEETTPPVTEPAPTPDPATTPAPTDPATTPPPADGTTPPADDTATPPADESAPPPSSG